MALWASCFQHVTVNSQLSLAKLSQKCITYLLSFKIEELHKEEEPEERANANCTEELETDQTEAIPEKSTNKVSIVLH